MSKLKQAFYENHSGSSITEINGITLSILLGHALYMALSHGGWVQTPLDQFSWSFACYVFNALLAITVYSGRQRQLLLVYGVPVVILTALNFWRRPSKARKSHGASTITDPERPQAPRKRPKVSFLSVYRASMMLTTTLSILAVDLPIFPRRYAKSETWGTSLMDLGVGSFVFSSGIVSSTQTFGALEGLRQGGVILSMGVARALMVRGSGYHEHVSEYGAHWNFFITLSLLPPLLPGFRKVQKLGLPFVVQGFAVCAAYQALLIKTNWQSWIISAPRADLLSANKEGLSSFVGYISIFLFGLDCGAMVLSKKSRPILSLLLISSMCFAVGYFFSNVYLQQRVSRRISNAPYIMWVAAHNSSFLFSLAVLEKCFLIMSRKGTSTSPESPISRLLERVNAKGLYVFLGSNLLTGTINLVGGDALMTTSRTVGLSIMIGYAMIICASAFYI